VNLIEQLGGYEKALQFLKSEKNSLEIDPVFYLDGQEILVDVLDDALLEYRRQHNIFEAGDVAVSVDGEPYLHKVELGTSKAHCIKIFSHDMAHSYWVHDVNYRHATDEEIKAGKRLEVNQ
jgi:hypothetical protein